MPSGNKRSRGPERSRSNSQEDEPISRMDDRDRRGPDRQPGRRTTPDPILEPYSKGTDLYKLYESQHRQDPYEQYLGSLMDPKLPPSGVFDSFDRSKHPSISSNPFTTPLFNDDGYVETPPPDASPERNSTMPPIPFEKVPRYRAKVSLDDPDFEVPDNGKTPSYRPPLLSPSPPWLDSDDVEDMATSKTDGRATSRSTKTKQLQKELKYECQTCAAKFPYRSYLERHVSTHSSEKPYPCKCGAKFKLKEYLDRHKKDNCKLTKRPQTSHRAGAQRSLLPKDGY